MFVNAAVFGVVLAVVLILVYMGFDKVDFDNDLEPWQKTALSGFVAGSLGYVAFEKIGLEDKVSKEE